MRIKPICYGIEEKVLTAWRELCEDMSKRIEEEKKMKEESISGIFERIQKENKVKSFKEKKYWKTEFVPKGQSPHVENIDRMSFPFWCWYLVEPVSKRTFGKACYKRLGMVNRVSDSLFVLFEVEKQTKGSNFVDGSESLLDLVRRRRITVCKGESKIWE